MDQTDCASSATSFLLAIGKWTLDTQKTSEIQEYIGKAQSGLLGEVGNLCAFENIQITELEGTLKSLTSVLASEFPNRLLIMSC